MTGIVGLEARLPTIGRLRLGDEQTDPKRPGKPLENWRFSSADRYALDELAAVMGGTVKSWDDGEQPWQLVCERNEIAVRLPPNPVSVAYEMWSSGGLQRRCNGADATLTVTKGEGKARTSGIEESPCKCILDGVLGTPAGCNLTTRLSVIIEDAPGIGTWLMTTHSRIAAMELPAQAQLLESLAGQGVYIPATLAIEHRSHRRRDETYERKYPVPALRIRATPRQLSDLGVAPTAAPALAPVAELRPASARAITDGRDSHHGPDSGRPFTAEDVKLAGLEFVNRFRRSMADNEIDEQTTAALLRYATGGRTGLAKAVLLTEVEAVRLAFLKLTEGRLCEEVDVDTGAVSLVTAPTLEEVSA